MQIGLGSEPVQNETHVPAPVSGSTSQQIECISQSSMPLSPFPTTVQGSPTSAASSAMVEQRVAFQVGSPSCDHGMHFWPTGQSSLQIEHSMIDVFASDGGMKPRLSTPFVLELDV